jgi:hypothetical protein
MKAAILWLLAPLALMIEQYMMSAGLIKCAVSLPNGATISLATGYGTSSQITAVSNANPAVATIGAGASIATGDIMVIKSGWSRLNDRVIRAAAGGSAVTLEGFDATDVSKFPVGTGLGSLVEVTGWQQITQILDTNSSGGEQQFVTYSFLEDDAEHQIPTVKSPMVYKFTIADDATLPHYAVLDRADVARTPQAVRLLLPTGSVVYWNAYVTLSRTPTLTKNQVMGLEVTMSLVSEVTRYVS